MSHGQDKHDVVARKPAILCNIAETSARQYEFAPPLFDRSPEERMLRKNLERAPYAHDLLTRPARFLNGDEFEQAL